MPVESSRRHTERACYNLLFEISNEKHSRSRSSARPASRCQRLRKSSVRLPRIDALIEMANKKQLLHMAHTADMADSKKAGVFRHFDDSRQLATMSRDVLHRAAFRRLPRRSWTHSAAPRVKQAGSFPCRFADFINFDAIPTTVLADTQQ